MQPDDTKGRERPFFLRALGRSEPPSTIEIDGALFERFEIFKHDSWAATAVYVRGEQRVVCKFNREAPIFLLPMGWVGRWLAAREAWFFSVLSGTPGIPRCYPIVSADGKPLRTACAHEFVEGDPLSLTHQVDGCLFDRLDELIRTLHEHRVAYIDLHKQENVIVGMDGQPYLIDFQISFWVPKWFGLGWFFRMLSESDLYHVDKHRRSHKQELKIVDMDRPWWILLHRKLTVPIRTLRRRLLVGLGIRNGAGYASSEIATEVGLRR